MSTSPNSPTAAEYQRLAMPAMPERLDEVWGAARFFIDAAAANASRVRCEPRNVTRNKWNLDISDVSGNGFQVPRLNSAVDGRTVDGLGGLFRYVKVGIGYEALSSTDHRPIPTDGEINRNDLSLTLFGSADWSYNGDDVSEPDVAYQSWILISPSADDKLPHVSFHRLYEGKTRDAHEYRQSYLSPQPMDSADAARVQVALVVGREYLYKAGTSLQNNF